MRQAAFTIHQVIQLMLVVAASGRISKPVRFLIRSPVFRHGCFDFHFLMVAGKINDQLGCDTINVLVNRFVTEVFFNLFVETGEDQHGVLDILENAWGLGPKSLYANFMYLFVVLDL